MNRTVIKQRGMILILVLACLTIATVLLMTGVKLAVSSHRNTRTFGWRAQAQCLAESGLELAASKLASDADYSGETWKISAEDLGGDYAAVVKIEVKPIPEQNNRRLVKIESDFPDDPVDRAQYTKELTVELP